MSITKRPATIRCRSATRLTAIGWGGFGTVIFKVREGAKVKIAEIRFVGNKNATARKLRGAMETKKWWMFSWLTGSGRFKDDQFEDDLDKLRDLYRELGFLDVEIPQDKVQFNYPTPEKLVLVVNITEGASIGWGSFPSPATSCSTRPC